MRVFHFGVLVAISIPIFTSQLEKSRDAVSVANLRSAYAEAATEVLTSNTLEVKKTVSFKGQVSSDNFSGLASELPFDVSSLTEPAAGEHEVTFTWTANSDAAPTVSW
ncbi:MAG: hypothetical protein IJ225_05630 [Solobacterium sp.]|nr:hypothetical protein [Solobacterium sp.]